MSHDIKDNWNQMAKAYEDFTEDEDSYSYAIEWPCIQKMLPDLKNKNIIDLGCGTGRFTFLLEKEQPNSIIGIDISEEMLTIAREKAEDKQSKASFLQGDISNFSLYCNEPIDFIFSSTTFHYIKDINQLFTTMYSMLSTNGSCVISLMHPIYTAQYPTEKNGEFPTDDDWNVRYLDKSVRAYIQPWVEYNDDTENYLSTSYHYTFSDYYNAILLAGFKVEQVAEPYPKESWKETCPNRYDSFIETPSYLIFKISK